MYGHAHRVRAAVTCLKLARCADTARGGCSRQFAGVGCGGQACSWDSGQASDKHNTYGCERSAITDQPSRFYKSHRHPLTRTRRQRESQCQWVMPSQHHRTRTRTSHQLGMRHLRCPTSQQGTRVPACQGPAAPPRAIQHAGQMGTNTPRRGRLRAQAVSPRPWNANPNTLGAHSRPSGRAPGIPIRTLWVHTAGHQAAPLECQSEHFGCAQQAISPRPWNPESEHFGRPQQAIRLRPWNPESEHFGRPQQAVSPRPSNPNTKAGLPRPQQARTTLESRPESSSHNRPAPSLNPDPKALKC